MVMAQRVEFTLFQSCEVLESQRLISIEVQGTILLGWSEIILA